MPERLAVSVISPTKRHALIMALPCFDTLNLDEANELAILMHEQHYAAGDVIVTEDALVDSVFILARGRAEVSRQVIVKKKITKKKKVKQSPLAILTIGDAIGLNDTGFFSTTGKRTATVTALTECILLTLDLKDLHLFLQTHPRVQNEMYAAAGQMLKMKLIKQSLPFSHLSHKHLQWLANKVEEVTVEAGALIFKQGDVGDRCYLIRSGQVEIMSQDEAGIEKRLAVLKSPTLFGEATLITRSPRNATARALERCELLMLRHEFLTELMESGKNVANMLMTLMVDRSRPAKNPHVLSHHRTAADKQPIVILKNPDNGNYFKLSEEGWYIWLQLDGKQTMHDITLALADKFSIFAPDVVAGLISKLAKAGFITNVEVDKTNEIGQQPYWIRMMMRIRRILEIRIAIGDSDKWLSIFYDKYAYLLFTRVGKWMLATLAITGIVACGLATPHLLQIFQTMHDKWLLLVFVVPFTLLSVGLHELGHALATKSFGKEVHYMGVGWNWFGPVAFTDTSDMWLGSRRNRIIVNLAGVYTDLVVAGIASLLIFIVSSSYVQGFLWIFAVYTYISAFRIMSPLQELDGYYVLMDMLDRPRLQKSAVLWLVKEFPKTLRQPSLLCNNKPEIIYWLACILFLTCVTVLTLLLQTFVFKIFGIQPSNHLISLMIPFMVLIASSLGIIADIRGKSEE